MSRDAFVGELAWQLSIPRSHEVTGRRAARVGVQVWRAFRDVDGRFRRFTVRIDWSSRVHLVRAWRRARRSALRGLRSRWSSLCDVSTRICLFRAMMRHCDAERSNQAMQRTAGRSAFTLSMTSNPSSVCDARPRPRSLILFSLDPFAPRVIGIVDARRLRSCPYVRPTLTRFAQSLSRSRWHSRTHSCG